MHFRNFKFALVAIIVSFTLTGCNSMPERVDMRNDRVVETMGLQYRDFDEAAAKMIDSLLGGRALVHPNGGRYILAIGDIKNDTMQRIDTDQLIKKIRIALLNSGRVVVSTAVGVNGAEDKMIYMQRELRGNSEFNQTRVAKKAQLQAFDLSMSGKILQRNVTTGGGKTQADYYFQLTITDVNTGLGIWEGEERISKRGSSRSVSW